MSRSYVVDASVALKWFLNEEHTHAATRLKELDSELHVPEFFVLEFGHAVCKKFRRREIDWDEGVQMIERIRLVPIQRHIDFALFPQALEIAFGQRCGLYDCLYLSLALSLDCEMVTADRRFQRIIENSRYANHVLWVEDLP